MSVPSSVSDAFIRVKAPSSSVVFDALVVIRKFIDKNEQNVKIVRERKVFKDLINILGKPNEKNLDITLSILGNCCLENESRIELVQLGIVKTIATVFNSSSRDAIQGRTCRIIGNLALTYNIAIELHKEKSMISNLVSIVDCGGSNSVASRQMAVRALRNLWVVEDERTSMLELNAVRQVALLLTTPYERKEQKELLKTVVKALAVFTHRCSEQCAIQVHPNDAVLKSLLSFCTKDEVKSSVILCVYNLCHIGCSRPILGCAGVVKVIVNELLLLSSEIAEPSESLSALMSSLCLLCRESVNRAKIRRAGGLSIILTILRVTRKPSLQSTALHALVLFLYDEMSLQELLKEGLVNALVMKLNNYVSQNGSEHEREYPRKQSQCSPKKRPISSLDCTFTVEDKTEDRFEPCGSSETAETSHVSDLSYSCENWKRFRVSSPNYRAVIQEFGFTPRCKKRMGSSNVSPPHTGEFVFRMNSLDTSPTNDYQMGEWSPGSSRSMCFSPDSSPQYGWHYGCSPTSLLSSPFDMWSSTSSPVSHGSVDCDIPEVYSPVCPDPLSDEECIEDDKHGCTGSHHSEEILEEQTTDSLNIQCDSSPDDNWEVLSNVSLDGWKCSEREEVCILILLSRISHMENMVEDLILKTTLSSLLNYIRLLRNPLPRAGRILGRIVRTHHYFIHLICHQFVLDIYSKFCQPLHTSCSACDKLNTVGKDLISKLSIVAESGFGEGELSHNVMKLDKSTRETVAVSVPFVIKDQKILRKILVICKGLDVLQNMAKSYSENSEFLQEYLPVSLSLLALSLQINNPLHSEYYGNNICWSHESETDFELLDPNDSVSFILDEGEIVSASKTLLTEQSPVFEAMLQGNFRESKQECISLGDISSNAFTHLLSLLKLGKVPHCLPSLHLVTAFELVIILDRFLIPGSKELSELIIHQFLQSCTVCDVYNNTVKYHGILEVFDNLRVKIIEYLLVSDMNMKNRGEIFTELLRGPNSAKFQDDLFGILRAKLSRRC